MEKNAQLNGLLLQWQESKAAAEAMLGRHIKDSGIQMTPGAADRPLTRKTLRQINKARKAERHAWESFSSVLESQLPE
jgi:hypothetical protein